jgi:glycosyltransferase involved in cell wall biosynthesis
VAARIRVLARQLNVDSLVRVLDHVSDASLAELYRGCLALVYPSFDEGFGLPLVEALAMGAPCVSSDISACREAAGALGIYVNPHSSDSIAAGMERVRDPAHRRHIAEAGPVWAERFSIGQMAENYVRIYAQALARRHIASASVRRGVDAPA